MIVTKIYSQFTFSVALAVIILFGAASCEKPKPAPAPKVETGTMTDRDGNVYTTVKIGDQWWMAENLQVKTFRNGDSVLYVSATQDWIKDTTSYCIVDAQFGFLYNAYVASDARRIAPEGWHIPSDEEWKTLERSLGMKSISADSIGWRGTTEGDQLKKAKLTQVNSTELWDYDPTNPYVSVWPNNKSGFTALPGSCRLFNGTMGFSAKSTGFWWSSSLHDAEVWYRYLDYQKSGVFRFYADKHSGYSIRCVKD